jgi:hypothetical protein
MDQDGRYKLAMSSPCHKVMTLRNLASPGTTGTNLFSLKAAKTLT